MFNIICNQGIGNLNNSEIQLHTYQNGWNPKNLTIPYAGKDVQPQELNSLLMEMQNGTPAQEMFGSSAVVLLGIYP